VEAVTNELRLLPWTSPDGKPCYLSSDGAGYVSQLADAVEAMQLELGQELLHHARAMLSGRNIPPGEFRFLAARLTEALHDVLHVARIRGTYGPCTAVDALDAAADELAAREAEAHRDDPTVGMAELHRNL
jgi:hypothetical protein